MNCSSQRKVEDGSVPAQWWLGSKARRPLWRGKGSVCQAFTSELLAQFFQDRTFHHYYNFFAFPQYLQRALDHLLIQLLWSFPRTVFNCQEPPLHLRGPFYILFQEDMMHYVSRQTTEMHKAIYTRLIQLIFKVNGESKEEGYTWGREVQEGVSILYLKAKKKMSETFTIVFPLIFSLTGKNSWIIKTVPVKIRRKSKWNPRE